MAHTQNHLPKDYVVNLHILRNEVRTLFARFQGRNITPDMPDKFKNYFFKLLAEYGLESARIYFVWPDASVEGPADVQVKAGDAMSAVLVWALLE